MINLGRIIAVDMGTSSAKVVRGRRSGNAIAVDRYANIPLPVGYKSFDAIKDKDAVVRAMKPALADAGIKRGRCILSVSTSDIIARPMVLPDMPEPSLKENIMYELNQYMPVDTEKYAVDYKAVRDTEDDSSAARMYIIAAAVSRTLLKDAVEIMHGLGLDVYAIDLDFNALARFFTFIDNVEHTADKDDSMVIDIGHEFVQVIIYNADKIYINRIINSGSYDIDVMVANTLDSNPTDVSDMKYSPSPDAQHEVYDAVINVFESIAAEIIRIMDYFNARYRGHAIERIYLSGGGAYINGIDEYIGQALGIPVSVPKPGQWLKLRKQQDEDNFDIPNFATALGLLLKGE
ncbi:type IV pilus assembly protein PilM [Mahella australiensis]|uniref:Type IV pilus assembly protein PilM n=1 Tax=Mahella australiensis (strain DSM 15567 / CIP 107919 / 50-1 BON) TaxID=697281 RepID=F4A391_MAHA5|nr:type IV pilus assembly protein PilM [Mahella australiensis]AEE96324.1 type IV pilus assembly protein PilM [Mahella australiensis 50-1 BON]